MALKDIPQTFRPDNEEEVRVAIAQFFRELGYDASEMSFEDNFTIHLGHAAIELGVAPKTKRSISKQRTQVAGRSDLLLARNGQSLAIIETKAPDHVLTDKDALQALSYARLLLSMPPYAIVTNGKDTRIYDTFAPDLRGLEELKELELPTESSWYTHGQQVLSLSDELRYQVARTLIGINPQTLHQFCQEQMSTALGDLKGMATEKRPYIPEVYLPRLQAEEQFTAWLSGDQPCFALVGDSGIGKTTMMCAAAEQLLADGYFVLFYSASNLQRDLETAICNDFVWEFHREQNLATIVERFEEIARTHGRKLFLFLDGLDRFPGKQEQFKAELLTLVPRLRNRSIKLCLSCKSFDWERFIIDDARSYNKLATAIFPQMQQSEAAVQPNAREIGVWLVEFTNEELDQVFPRYQRIFSLQGSLEGTTRKACHHPLILRLLAEVWSSQNKALPQEISQLELFEEYWRIQLNKVPHKLEAEHWLSELARISVESGERQISLTELRQHLLSQSSQSETYQELQRSGLLSVSSDKYGEAMLSFGLDMIRSYVYTIKAQTWPRNIERGKSQEIASLICQLLEHPTGVEVVEFYIRTIDRGETQLLTDIALHDIFKFVQLLELLRVRSFVFAATTGEEQRQGFISYLRQFVIAYSDLLHKYFPDLCEKIEPYKKGAVGLWISGSPSSTMYQFRERTQAMPDPLLILPPDVASALSKKQVSPEFYDQVRPGGRVSFDLRGFGLVEHLPQKKAWNHLLSQVAGLLGKRCLDESESPFLLQERIWRLISEEPAGIWGDVPITTKYWQDFGFQNLEEIQDVPLEEVITRTQALIEEYMVQFGGQIQQHIDLIQQQERNTSAVTEPTWSRWYVTYIRKLRRLDYYLHQSLQLQQSHLTFPDWRFSNVFDYLRTGDLVPIIQLLQQILPHILQSYMIVAQKNISFFADQLALFRHSDASMLIEVTRESSNPAFHSDFLKIAYVVLPTTNLPNKYMVYTCQEKDSVKHILLQRKTLQGHWLQTSGIQGAGFGQGEISQQIEGRYINEPNAFFYFTLFPNRYPILDQIYQLLGNELYILLDGNFSDWHNIEHGKIDDEMLDMLIDLQAGRI